MVKMYFLCSIIFLSSMKYVLVFVERKWLAIREAVSRLRWPRDNNGFILTVFIIRVYTRHIPRWTHRNSPFNTFSRVQFFSMHFGQTSNRPLNVTWAYTHVCMHDSGVGEENLCSRVCKHAYSSSSLSFWPLNTHQVHKKQPIWRCDDNKVWWRFVNADAFCH